ncbi:MAG: KamA family protein [Bacteroidales bacterium]|nr:KamA family protein [Bacteroidales bacterium]
MRSVQHDDINLSLPSLKIVQKIIKENPEIAQLFKKATEEEACEKLRIWLTEYFDIHPLALDYYQNQDQTNFDQLMWEDYAAIRLMDYIDHEGYSLPDPNLSNKVITSSPIKRLWRAIKLGKGNAKEEFFLDMLYLFRQLNHKLERNIPNKQKLVNWMAKHPSGMDKRIIKERKEAKDRIIRKIIDNIDKGIQRSNRFQFESGSNAEDKFRQVNEWWNNYRFHLSFAIRSPEILNDLLDHSLSAKTMKKLFAAREKGIPLFVNPHYLSLISVKHDPHFPSADLAIREYVFPSQKLIDFFGEISAWEKEDKVRPGEPNAAGWLLPGFHNIHRRYPEVAIFIPDTTGRACGGLCVSCQRMYDFQSGHFNFDITRLAPKITWPEKMRLLMDYFEKDTQLRDILITGGDAFMNSDAALKQILEAVYEMAVRKKEANKNRKEGEKYAEMMRIRLGTRLPVYIPQRITDSLCKILADFRKKAQKIGFRQFIIQTHVESAMEITPEMKNGMEKIQQAGWLITNQQVFTTAASFRGHTAKLRQELNNLGMLPYYTFSVKGYMENNHNFATNARIVQEKTEEKYLGTIPESYFSRLHEPYEHTTSIKDWIQEIREKENLPFLATDRNMMNLPAVGKSLTFRVIGITKDGRRILRFRYDTKRKHSPITKKAESVIIVESKSIAKYLRQLENSGQNIQEYQTIWGYSMNETETGSPLYQYPEYEFRITKEFSNIEKDLI